MVLEGVVIGLLFTAAVGVLTFGLHQRLPYRRLLIITGVLLLFVLLVQVGEEVNEMQLAGWIGTTEIHWLSIPGWMGTWLSLFNNWETFAAQFAALAIVVGSYLPRSTCACGVRGARAASPRGSLSASRPGARPTYSIRVAPSTLCGSETVARSARGSPTPATAPSSDSAAAAASAAVNPSLNSCGEA